MSSTEKIWYDNPIAFFSDPSKITKFIPDKDMSLTEQLNASFRFALYFSLAVWLIRRDINVLYFAIFAGLMTILLYKFDKQGKSQKASILEKMDLGSDRVKGICVKPTVNNPFMNVGYTDYKDFPNRPQACNVMNKPVKKMIKKYFDTNLNRSEDDIFHKSASDRQFYTMPSTTIPNDQGSFADWCYKPKKTCKEDSIQC